jgi:hypothetical protein
MRPDPKFHIFQLAEASFERISKFANGKLRAFYRCRHSATAGAHRGHHRDICLHHDSLVLGELKKGQNNRLNFVQLRLTQFGFA